jgi:hypothetical protein
MTAGVFVGSDAVSPLNSGAGSGRSSPLEARCASPGDTGPVIGWVVVLVVISCFGPSSRLRADRGRGFLFLSRDGVLEPTVSGCTISASEISFLVRL